MNQLGIDQIPRDELYARWTKDHEGIAAEAVEAGVTLPFYLEELSPKADPSAPNLDAMAYLLARDSLATKSFGGFSTASVKDFLKHPRTEALFWAQLDLDYDMTSSIHEVEMKQLGIPDLKAAAANTDAAQTDNTPFKPRFTRALYENRRFRPQVTIADIASAIETIPGTTFQIPKYDTPPDREYPVVIPEGGKMAVTTLKTETANGRTFTVGEGLATSRKFELNDLRMQTVRIWVRRVAMRHEATIVNRGINMLYDVAGADVNIGDPPTLNSILKVVLHFTDQVNNGYNIDRLFGLKGTVEEWILANVESNANRFPFEPPEGRFSQIFGGVQLGNGGMEPPIIYAVGPNSQDENLGVKVATDDLLGIDSRFGLVLYRQARGLLQEEKYDAQTQLRERYLSQEVGWQPQDEEAVVKFHFG